MRKNVIEEKVLKGIQKVASVEVARNKGWWPPICTGIVHQPKRPKMK